MDREKKKSDPKKTLSILISDNQRRALKIIAEIESEKDRALNASIQQLINNEIAKYTKQYPEYFEGTRESSVYQKDLIFEKDQSNIKILVIEDEIAAREKLAGELKTAGYHVASCETATSAIAIMKKEDFDGIIIDYYLPDCDDIPDLVNTFLSIRNTFEYVIFTGASIDTSITDDLKKAKKQPTDYINKYKTRLKMNRFLKGLKNKNIKKTKSADKKNA